jgi:hypothetical protein
MACHDFLLSETDWSVAPNRLQAATLQSKISLAPTSASDTFAALIYKETIFSGFFESHGAVERPEPQVQEFSVIEVHHARSSANEALRAGLSATLPGPGNGFGCATDFSLALSVLAHCTPSGVF